MGIRSYRVTSAAFALMVCLLSATIGPFGLIPPAMAQAGALTKQQSDALATYDAAARNFEAILAQRRAQIASRQLPNLPGQALYLARNVMMSAYKDLTDALPSKIGRPNKFGIPPAYFDADSEPLIDEYKKLFEVMQAPPANAQNSATPFKDVVDLGTAIARAKGLDAATAEAAGRISLGLFFAETNGNQNIGNARSNTYKGSFQTGPSEDQNGRKKWAAIKPSIAAFDPALIARDDKEEARAGNLDHRYNHWTAVRDGLMNAHAETVPADTGDRENAARSDRPDEAVRTDPDRPSADQVRAQIGQPARLPDFRSDDHEISAQQQRVRLRPGRPGQNIRDFPRDYGCDVAVQRKIRTGACHLRRDQGAAQRLIKGGCGARRPAATNFRWLTADNRC